MTDFEDYLTETGYHSTRSDHYRGMASAAMDSANKTQFPSMRAELLKLAAAWHDLAAETDLSKH
jgi:HD superfamily phosphohydrolase YqeK